MLGSPIELSMLPMSELEAAVELATADIDFSTSMFPGQQSSGPNAWVAFEATVRSAASTALGNLRAQGPPCAELFRLCEFEEQTRCQAFQAAMMGEVAPTVYQATARSIVEKLLGKLETYAPEPSLYQGAAQCLSEYMSALNHHCDICVVPRAHSPLVLQAIPEGISEAGVSSDYPSELGSEDAETLSVHSEATDGSHRRRWAPSPASALVMGGTGVGACAGARATGTISSAALSAPTSGAELLGACCGSCSSSGGGSSAVDGYAGLSMEELKKRQRREANKKASVKYRSNKSRTVQSIIAEQAGQRQQIAALSSQNAVLTAENSLLKQQVAFLQSMLQGHGGGMPGIPGAVQAPTTSTAAPTAAAAPMDFPVPAGGGAPSTATVPPGVPFQFELGVGHTPAPAPGSAPLPLPAGTTQQSGGIVGQNPAQQRGADNFAVHVMSDN